MKRSETSWLRALLAIGALALAAAPLSACGNGGSDMDEMVEEAQDEAEDAMDELEDEYDDRM